MAGPVWGRDEAGLDDASVVAATNLLAPVPHAPSAMPAPAGSALLMLDVELNGVNRGLLPFTMIDSQLWATRQVLLDIGLRIDSEPAAAAADDLLSLTDTVGTGTSYNAASQSLSILVDVEKLAVGTHRLNVNAQDQRVAASATGALLNYDIYANLAGGRLAFDGFGELRAFSGNVLFETTGVFNSRQQAQQGGKLARLDSTLSWSIPDKRLTLRAGDIITRATSWSRPTRLGGLRIGTDFALQPYLVTAPIPSFFGEATLPSTVDLYIDGMKRFSGSVAPGPFELGSGGNHINGAGNAQLVVTDAIGQVTTLDFPIYDTPLLLRAGLTDWSVELGALRRDYGLANFSYAENPVLTGSLRSGLSNSLTLEAHGEAGSGLVNAGGGLAWLLPFGGVVSGSLAASSNDGRMGQRVEAVYSWTDSKFNLSATVQRASSDFADLPSLEGASNVRARDVFNAGYNSDHFGYFGVNLIRQRAASEPRESYLSLHWQKSFGTNLALGLSGNMGLRRGAARGVFLTLSYTPGERDHFSASVQGARGRNSGSLGYRHSLPLDGGTGWALDGSYDGDRLQAAGQVDHLGSHGQVTGGARMIGGRASAYAGYSGALVAMGGDVFVARKIYDGFAVVDTAGIADVPVLLHNRAIGQSNASGHLLVTGLNSYQDNKVAIDPSQLPASLTVGALDRNAVPSLRSGVTVAFAIAPTTSVLVSLVDASGAEIAMGARAIMAGDERQALMVGFGGQLYIDQAIPGAQVQVSGPQGGCFIRLPNVLPSDGAGMLGRMTCEEEQA
ncbi:MAG: fimbria/pilus outer membrane usher protein [Alteraurantiacibacter sp.]